MHARTHARTYVRMCTHAMQYNAEMQRDALQCDVCVYVWLRIHSHAMSVRVHFSMYVYAYPEGSCTIMYLITMDSGLQDHVYHELWALIP